MKPPTLVVVVAVVVAGFVAVAVAALAVGAIRVLFAACVILPDPVVVAVSCAEGPYARKRLSAGVYKLHQVRVCPVVDPVAPTVVCIAASILASRPNPDSSEQGQLEQMAPPDHCVPKSYTAWRVSEGHACV